MSNQTAQERKMAQGQAAKTLNILGYCEKHRDGVKCPTCYSTVIQHTDIGVADYIAAANGHAFCVEVKAGGERFSFAELRQEQRDWMHDYEYRSRSTPWIWLLMGTDKAGSKSTQYPRATFLLTLSAFEYTEKTLWDHAQVKSLPLNTLAAQTRVATREKNLYATALLNEYRMDWMGNNLWWPHQGHFFWYSVGIPDGDPMRIPQGKVAA